MLNLAPIRAITLDLDDTLWPVAPTLARAEAQLAQWLGQHAPRTAATFADPQARQALRQRVVEQMAHLRHDLSAIRLEMLRQALQQAGEDLELAHAGFAVFYEARMQVDLFDDALEGLSRLAQRYPLLAVSNGNADIHKTGVGRHFVGSLSARDAGVAKPDPRIFLAAAHRLGVPPHQVLHVGDDPVLDVEGALRSSMQAVWINRTALHWGLEVRPHAHAANLLELCALLGA